MGAEGRRRPTARARYRRLRWSRTSDETPPTPDQDRPLPIDHDNLDAATELAAREGREVAPDGDVADYIPALADVDPQKFAMVLSGIEGEDHATGDADELFPIQSISKVFSLVLAMQKIDAHGAVADELWNRVGREPSGDPFNSLVQLEHEGGVPRNPMINAGALVVDDILLDKCDDAEESFVELMSELAGEDVTVDQRVLDSEAETGYRNQAMASLMRSFGNLRNEVDEVLRVYIQQCAVSMTTRQLARATRFLANDGIDPGSGKRILSAPLARRVNAIMLTCGTYDAAGEFAFSVGLPCKSGVAGGIIAVVPDRIGVCVWSPPLDESGNSRGGRVALHHLAEELDLSIF
jgi:glutaminase